MSRDQASREARLEAGALPLPPPNQSKQVNSFLLQHNRASHSHESMRLPYVFQEFL